MKLFAKSILIPVLFLSLCIQAGCCREGARQAPPYFEISTKYYLSPRALRSSLPVTKLLDASTGGACATTELVELCVVPEVNYLRAEIRNLKASEVLVDWTKARWIDELGQSHELDAWPGDELHPNDLAYPPYMTKLKRFETEALDLWPAGKIYYVGAGCNNAAIFREPLIPMRLSGDPITDEETVDRMYESSGVVSLVIPFQAEIHGTVQFELELITWQELRRRGAGESPWPPL